MMRADLAERAAALSAAGVPYVQATVVRAQAPASVLPGDTALVLADGALEGFVGGDCARTSVRHHGLSALSSGEAVLLRIRPGAPTTAIEPGTVTVGNPCLSGGALEIFLEPHRPAPVLTVVGDTPTARAVARVAAAVGFTVAAGGTASVSADSLVVVATHGGPAEAPALYGALAGGAAYVGLVASRRRGAAVLAGLGLPPEAVAGVRCPAGLAIGARSPEEIALSIVTEVVAMRRGAQAAQVTAVAPQTAVDPVCGMTVAVTADTPGADGVWFCGEGCRRAYATAR